MLKIYLKSYLFLIISYISLTFIFSIMSYYFNLFTNINQIIILSISFLISTIILGKKIKQKSYLEGIKFSSIYLVLVSILKIIFKSVFNFKVFIIYILIIISSIIGSTVGINLKK